MIPTHPEWLEEIVKYAELVLDDRFIRDNWIDQSNLNTSIYSPTELISQVFVDLNAKEGLAQLEGILGWQSEMYGAVSDFIEQLDELSEALPDEDSPENIAEVLRLAQWRAVRDGAAKVTQQFELHNSGPR